MDRRVYCDDITSARLVQNGDQLTYYTDRGEQHTFSINDLFPDPPGGALEHMTCAHGYLMFVFVASDLYTIIWFGHQSSNNKSMTSYTRPNHVLQYLSDTTIAFEHASDTIVFQIGTDGNNSEWKCAGSVVGVSHGHALVRDTDLVIQTEDSSILLTGVPPKAKIMQFVKNGFEYTLAFHYNKTLFCWYGQHNAWTVKSSVQLTDLRKVKYRYQSDALLIGAQKGVQIYRQHTPSFNAVTNLITGMTAYDMDVSGTLYYWNSTSLISVKSPSRDEQEALIAAFDKRRTFIRGDVDESSDDSDDDEWSDEDSDDADDPETQPTTTEPVVGRLNPQRVTEFGHLFRKIPNQRVNNPDKKQTHGKTRKLDPNRLADFQNKLQPIVNNPPLPTPDQSTSVSPSLHNIPPPPTLVPSAPPPRPQRPPRPPRVSRPPPRPLPNPPHLFTWFPSIFDESIEQHPVSLIDVFQAQVKSILGKRGFTQFQHVSPDTQHWLRFNPHAMHTGALCIVGMRRHDDTAGYIECKFTRPNVASPSENRFIDDTAILPDASSPGFSTAPFRLQMNQGILIGDEITFRIVPPLHVALIHCF